MKPTATQPVSPGRRRFLRGAAALGLVPVLGVPAVQASDRPASRRARKLIFMVSDGMNHGTLALAEQSRRLEGDETAWMALYRRPGVHRALMGTRSASALVPDSAAAASAWSIGQPVNNRSLNVLPDGGRPMPLWPLAAAHGCATGLVTTTRITHSTPAAFVCNRANRDEEDQIAEDYLARKVDVLLGGGQDHFDPASRKDGLDLYAAYRVAGYHLVTDAAGVQAGVPAGKKLLGLFYPSHLPYSVDSRHDPSLRSTVPTLAAMTDVALQQLDTLGDRCVLMVEGGRVDHAGHGNDAAAILNDQLAFDDAVALVLKYQEEHPDTLVVLCTDHGTGGCMFNGLGSNYTGSEPALGYLSSLEYSFEALASRFREAHSKAEVEAVIQTAFQIEPTSVGLADYYAVHEAWLTKRAGNLAVANALGRLLVPYTAVGWTSGQHTGDWVEFAALGPGSERLPQIMANTDVHDWLLASMGWSPRNSPGQAVL